MKQHEELKTYFLAIAVVVFFVFGMWVAFAVFPWALFQDGPGNRPETLTEVQKERSNDEIPAPSLPVVSSEDVLPAEPEEPELSDVVPLAPGDLPAEQPASSSVEAVIFFDTTFTAQAPLGQWQDPRQQDGCEESSALIAVSAMRGETFTLEEAQKEIIAASEYQLATYGSYHDTSAHDTAERIVREYFEYAAVEVKEDVTIEDIIDELRDGNLIIAPMNGRLLGNPFYKAPGPERHMLVVKGYNPATGEFITDDVGTRRGESFRYSSELFYEAIRDYPTGAHEPFEDNVPKKNIVVVKPEQKPKAPIL